MIEQELKPCPFCGSSDLPIEGESDGDTYTAPNLSLYCRKCGATCEMIDRYHWNTRASDKLEAFNKRVQECCEKTKADMMAEIERLRAALEAIQKHVDLAGGAKLSAVWHIAEKALKEGE